jgi:hypothetical protein
MTTTKPYFTFRLDTWTSDGESKRQKRQFDPSFADQG